MEIGEVKLKKNLEVLSVLNNAILKNHIKYIVRCDIITKNRRETQESHVFLFLVSQMKTLMLYLQTLMEQKN